MAAQRASAPRVPTLLARGAAPDPGTSRRAPAVVHRLPPCAEQPGAQATRVPDGTGHLRYDPRTLDIGQYLQRPDHELSRSRAGAQLPVRRHQGHDAPLRELPRRRGEPPTLAALRQRTWLRTLACESCHIPKLHAPAIQVTTGRCCRPTASRSAAAAACWGLATTRTAAVRLRPVLTAARCRDGGSQLAPYNLVTTFYWVYDDPGGTAPPGALDLRRPSRMVPGHAAIVKAFDQNRDGRLDAPRLPHRHAGETGRGEGPGWRWG